MWSVSVVAAARLLGAAEARREILKNGQRTSGSLTLLLPAMRVARRCRADVHRKIALRAQTRPARHRWQFSLTTDRLSVVHDLAGRAMLVPVGSPQYARHHLSET